MQHEVNGTLTTQVLDSRSTNNEIFDMIQQYTVKNLDKIKVC